MDQFLIDNEPLKGQRCKVLSTGLEFKPDQYEYDDKFVPGDGSVFGVHTVTELISLLEKDKRIEVDARVLVADRIKESLRLVPMGRDRLLESFKKNSRKKGFRESFDSFSYDGPQAGLIGEDYVPLLGGPFNKQLYYYDYLRMHGLAFQAYQHDPLAHAIIQMSRNFVLGRGFEIKATNEKFHALWEAFSQVNDMNQYVDDMCIELALYGEVMNWWLPNKWTKIQYQPRPGQEVPKGLLPRVRLIDPSVIWEVVTMPEDISRVLYYQWIAPTQYQTYTAPDVPTAKFIFQQIPAEQVQHVKINAVSNEKRGRSDLFPILGYLKRLRDSVNYQIVALQKDAAWCMDTTVEGSQTDINNYISDQQALGQFAPAGSEFVHSAKIKREYRANSASAAKGNPSFDWVLSMIAAGCGIPMNYFGTHLSGGQTRASAIVATEPVAKKWQHRQMIIERIIKGYANRLGNLFGFKDSESEIEVIFPEIVIQDRSAKMKDLALAETQEWFSKETCADIAAKEFSIDDFDYEKEKLSIQADPPPTPQSPLTQGAAPDQVTDTNALPGDERNDIKAQR